LKKGENVRPEREERKCEAGGGRGRTGEAFDRVQFKVRATLFPLPLALAFVRLLAAPGTFFLSSGMGRREKENENENENEKRGLSLL
jgi:hypothetical protein